MNIRHLSLILCTALVVACGGGSASGNAEREVFSTDPRAMPPEPGEARPFALPAPVRYELDNGLEVVVIERPNFPSVAMRLSIRAGYDSIPESPAVAEVLARTLMEGTESMDAAELARRVDSSGVAISVGATQNRLVVSASGVSTTTDAMLGLLGELVTSARFPDERVEARRDELVDEIALSASQPSYHANQQIRRVLFGDHVYGNTISPADVMTVEGSSIREFYEESFGPSRAQLVIVGQVSGSLRSQLDTTLGQWTRSTPDWQAPDLPRVATCNDAHVVLRPESAQTAIRFVGPATSRTEADYFPALVANQVLGGGPSARLFMNLREDKSYTYGAYSGMRHLVGASYFSASSDVRSDVTAGALAEFSYEFDRLGQNSIGEDELGEATDYLAGVYPIDLERNSGIAAKVSELLSSDLPIEFLTDYRSNVRSVSTQEANAAGVALSNNAGLALVMVGVEDVVVPAAIDFSSHVYVYDLEGVLIEELDGNLERRCTE